MRHSQDGGGTRKIEETGSRWKKAHSRLGQHTLDRRERHTLDGKERHALDGKERHTLDGRGNQDYTADLSHVVLAHCIYFLQHPCNISHLQDQKYK